MIKNIYILEDEITTSIAIRAYLSSLEYTIVGYAEDASVALEEIITLDVDLIISDISLKGKMDGCAFAKIVKLKYNIPIIIISAYFDDEILQELYEANVTNYLIKPYTNIELKIALKLLKTKDTEIKSRKNLTYFDLYSFDLDSKELFKDEHIIDISDKVTTLLELLIKNKNSSTSKYLLYQSIYGEDKKYQANTLRQFIKRVKSKYKFNSIQSVWGKGYTIKIN